MAVSYTTLKTENLGNDQERITRAYEVAGVGTILNSLVKLTHKPPYTSDTDQYISDVEIFLPNIPLAALTGMSFTVLDTVTLDAGQKRIIREHALYTGDKIVQVLRTQDYKLGKVDKSIIIGPELLSYVPALSAGIRYKTPQGTWQSSTSVTFKSRLGQPSTNHYTLSDGVPRSFAGTLAWSSGNNVGDLGWDSEGSQAIGDKWVFFYLVPTTTSNTLMTMVASANPPTIGPAGRSAFALCWVDYRASGSLLKIRQNGNQFLHTFRNVYQDSNISDEGSYTSVSLENYAPVTASAIELTHLASSYGTQLAQDRWNCWLSMSNSDSDAVNLLDVRSRWDIQRTPKEITSISDFSIPAVPATHTGVTAVVRSASPTLFMGSQSDTFKAPFFGARTIYKKRDRVAGSEQNLWWNRLQSLGWVDEWIEP